MRKKSTVVAAAALNEDVEAPPRPKRQAGAGGFRRRGTGT